MVCGLSWEDVWIRMKPVEVVEYINLFDEVKLASLQWQYNLCWLSGLYSRIAFHSPKDYPVKPEQLSTNKSSSQSDEEQNAVISSILAGL